VVPSLEEINVRAARDFRGPARIRVICRPPSAAAPIIGRVRIALGTLCVGLALAACSSGSSGEWKSLRSVRVTVAQPGLPPPFGRPKTTSFTSPAEVARVTRLLNAHHIARAPSTSSSSGCAGGFQIGIAIVPSGGAPVNLSAYRCANQTSGNVKGDLVGFLRAIGTRV